MDNNFFSSVNNEVVDNKKRKNKKGIIVIVIIFLILGGAFVYYYIDINKKMDELRKTIDEKNNKIKELEDKNNNNKESKNNKVLEYEYFDMHIPGTTYYVKLTFNTKELYVKEAHGCSALDCEDTTSENTIILEEDIINKIDKITKNDNYNKETLSISLSSLVLGDKKMFEKSDIYYNQEEDLNNDGIVTYKENGISILNDILKES